MARKKEPVTLETLVDGKPLRVWNEKWVIVPDGFEIYQTQLKNDIGIFAAKQGDAFRYIGYATQISNNGLAWSLSRPRVKNPSGDKGGIRKIWENRKDVDAFVLCVESSIEGVKAAKDLCRALRDLHDPKWNRKEEVVKAAIKASYEARPKGVKMPRLK